MTSNTMTATASGTVPDLAAVLESLKARIDALERKNSLQHSFAQQLFLNNLGRVNEPNIDAAWQRTEQQLKFLQEKLS